LGLFFITAAKTMLQEVRVSALETNGKFQQETEFFLKKNQLL
jgi:hypothetical protein